MFDKPASSCYMGSDTHQVSDEWDKLDIDPDWFDVKNLQNLVNKLDMEKLANPIDEKQRDVRSIHCPWYNGNQNEYNEYAKEIHDKQISKSEKRAQILEEKVKLAELQKIKDAKGKYCYTCLTDHELDPGDDKCACDNVRNMIDHMCKSSEYKWDDSTHMRVICADLCDLYSTYKKNGGDNLKELSLTIQHFYKNKCPDNKCYKIATVDGLTAFTCQKHARYYYN